MSYDNWSELTAHLPGDVWQPAVKDEHVVENFTGDDNGGVVDDDYKHIYNDITISEVFSKYGMNYTPPEKQGVQAIGVCSLEDFVYLKSNFVRDDRFGDCWRMALKDEVLREMLNWVTDSGDPWDLLMMTIDDSMRGMFAHGKVRFDDHKNAINRVLRGIGKPPLTHDYDVLLRDFYRKHGKNIA